ncbi:MAG: putative motility protein [bacterium]|nr:putative motility protein [bacterium]
MSHVTEIASAARHISSEDLAIAAQKAQLSVLKTQMDVQAQVQMEMVAMLRDIQTHLGTNVNITA